MKSMAELEAIRKKTLARINLRREDASKLVRVVVGMGTCGIAAGARDRGARLYGRSQTSAAMQQCDRRSDRVHRPCASLEPMVEVFVPGQDKVTYVQVTPEMVPPHCGRAYR